MKLANGCWLVFHIVTAPADFFYFIQLGLQHFFLRFFGLSIYCPPIALRCATIQPNSIWQKPPVRYSGFAVPVSGCAASPGRAADAARAILDGHIVLSRSLAEAGHYPAIDIEQSASRVMHNVVSRDHFELARRFRAVNSRYQKGRDLVQIGAYVSGSDPALDEAIRLHLGMTAFLQQDMHASAQFEDCLGQMSEALESGISAP